MKIKYFISLFLLTPILLIAQEQVFTAQDSLRGSITPERAWWDLKYYHLSVDVDPGKKYIEGTNVIEYQVLEQSDILQIDLQPPLKIDQISQNGVELSFQSNGNAHFVQLREDQEVGSRKELVISYSGLPREAQLPPWDGGFSWEKDTNGKHFVATSCQGIGASIWWPNKDHMYDEVDSMRISVSAPEDLIAVAHGRLERIDNLKEKKT